MTGSLYFSLSIYSIASFTDDNTNGELEVILPLSLIYNFICKSGMFVSLILFNIFLLSKPEDIIEKHYMVKQIYNHPVHIIQYLPLHHHKMNKIYLY